MKVSAYAKDTHHGDLGEAAMGECDWQRPRSRSLLHVPAKIEFQGLQ